MFRKTLIVMLICTGLVTLVVGLTAAQVAETDDQAGAPTDPPLEYQKDSYRYTSNDGNFEVTWPSGCGRLRIRANDPEFFVGEEDNHQIMVQHVVCERSDTEGDGCTVTATFNSRTPDGADAGVEQVLARVRNTLKTYSVNVTKQTPLKKEFPNGLVVEGVDVIGTGPDGKGEIMVRGLLASPDIYILTAWSIHGSVWDNPEYQEFFNTFTPYLE